MLKVENKKSIIYVGDIRSTVNRCYFVDGIEMDAGYILPHTGYTICLNLRKIGNISFC